KKGKKAAGAGAARTAIADPWGLGKIGAGAGGGSSGWKKVLHGPPLEMFNWHRVVVDEYTYVELSRERDRTAIKRGLTGTHRWCLSGTPAIADFAGVKGMAEFLGAHLGVDDAPTAYKKEEQTGAEQFAYFRDKPTAAWHARRHALAQVFLDRFVRQNKAEIDEIPFTAHVLPVVLPPAERALYLELLHHLQAMDMKTKRSLRGNAATHGDRESRLRKALGQADSPQEALLWCCSHFSLRGADVSAQAACTNVVDFRRRQMKDARKQLRRELRKATQLRTTALK
ncbi:unnamed protein product, partial [Phaeothamnion confervicola]